jgi:hypothetical protein
MILLSGVLGQMDFGSLFGGQNSGVQMTNNAPTQGFNLGTGGGGIQMQTADNRKHDKLK